MKNETTVQNEDAKARGKLSMTMSKLNENDHKYQKDSSDGSDGGQGGAVMTS